MKKVFLLAVLYFSLSSITFASTIIDTDITENTTWTKDQSPYVIDVPITIATGVALTIDPGVIVKFDYGNFLTVDGAINALGTNVEPIYFTSYYDDSVGGDTNGDGAATSPDTGDWYFIMIESPSMQSTLNHVILRYSDDELLLFNGGSVSSDSLDSDQGIMARGSRSSFVNLKVKNLDLGYNSVFSIDGATISNPYGSSIDVFLGSSLSLKNSIINDRNNYGRSSFVNIYQGSSANFDSVNIVGNIFFDTAVAVFGNSSLIINKSSISETDIGLEVFDGSHVTINDSSVSCVDDGIYVFNNSTLNFSKGSVSCGSYGILLFDGARANIDSVKITNASYSGVLAFGNTSSNGITITKSEITGNKDGFEVFNTAISAHQNNIHDNDFNGVSAFSPLTPNQFDFTFNYWGDPSGPMHTTNLLGTGDAISGEVLFTPWLTSNPLVTGYSNVLFLPGLEASRLYKNRSVVCQINCEDQLWEPNTNSDVEDLYLNTYGTSINPDIYTRDIIKETNTPISLGMVGQNIYKSFSKTMDDLTNPSLPKRMARWEAYAYDWRQGVDDIVNNGTSYKKGRKSLITTLENLVASSTTGKVTIIAHSNGGLVAKALLVKLQEMKNAGTSNLIDKIDNLILVAVPQIGTASAVPAILHGYDQAKLGGLLMTKTRARELGRNMESAYGLLPSREYLNRVDISPVTFSDTLIPSGVTTPYINQYGTILDSYHEYIDFLKGADGRSQPNISDTLSPIKLSEQMLLSAETFHNKIDNWEAPASLKVFEVAGWGLDTVASFLYKPSDKCVSTQGVGVCQRVLEEKPMFTADGDVTVVSPSAMFGVGEKVWVNIPAYNAGLTKNRDHGSILEITEIDNFISSIIKKEIPVYGLVLATTKPTDDTNRLRISIHSPVTIGAYDKDENFTGKVCSLTSDFCYAQEDIPNSSYIEFGEGKYINMPEESVQKVILQGTDIGTFTYESAQILPDGQSATTTFMDIPVTAQTKAEVTLNATQIPELALDVNGDGSVDFNITPQTEFDPILFLQIMRKTVEGFDINKGQKQKIYSRIDDTIKVIQKGKIGKAKLKVEQFKKIFVAESDRKEKPNHLTQTNIQMLITMLNQLLDNLNK